MSKSKETKKLSLNSLKYEDINSQLINALKDPDQFVEVVTIWKSNANGKRMDLKLSRTKTAIIQHFLYSKSRDKIMIYTMNHTYS